MKGFLKIAGITLGVVLVSAIAVGAFVVVDYINRFNADAVALEDAPEVEPPSISAFPGEFSVLLIGTDECGEVSGGLLGERCSEADGGILNDVNLLVHVSAEPRNVTVVSLPRDLMIETPECTREDGSIASATSKTQINSIYQNAGLSCVAKTITDLSGVEIPFAAKIDFDGVMAITDAIGGVEVCIAQPIQDPIHTHLDLAAGEHTLVGVEALQFLRVRHGVGDGSDLSRISNQQVYMGALVRKLVSDETLGDFGALLRLANAVVHNTTLDDALAKPSTMVSIASALKDVPTSEYEFIQFPYVEYAPNPNKVAPDTYTWEQIKAALDAGQSVIAQDATEEPTDEPTETPTIDPTTDPNQVVLPSNIRGSSADEATCSNSGTIF